jgi:pyruvate/2-oxoglutarate/acetoin dehydrogenase E1 component
VFVHSPGLKVVMPSSAADAKGLMKAAIPDNNPVLFFVDIGLMHNGGAVSAEADVVRLGKASICRKGRDVTLVSYGKSVHACMEAATTLEQRGISAEVIDLRSLKPLDEDAILASGRKTGRVVVVHEASAMCGVGAEVAALVSDRAFAALRAPVKRITGPDAPAPSSYALEQAFVPQAPAIVETVMSLMATSEHSVELV